MTYLRKHKLTFVVALASAAGMLGLYAKPANAATVTVNTTNMSYVNDGACGLAEAIVAVNTARAFDGCPAGNGKNDTIVVPVGQYSANQSAPLAITASVTIQGAGNMVGVGSETGMPVQTVITGDSLAASANGLFTVSDAAHAITVNFEGLALEISNPGSLPISGIYGAATQLGTSVINVSGSLIYGFGLSGISINGYTLSVLNTHLLSNYNCTASCGDSGEGGGTGFGGGIEFLGFGSLTVSNSTIEYNVSDLQGGGIDYEANTNSSLITNSTISNNLCGSQSGTSSSSGGGIFLNAGGGSLTIAGSTVAFNNAASYGGGIFAIGNYGDNAPRTYTLVDSIVSNNVSVLDQNEDDDLYSDGSLTVKSSLILAYFPGNGQFKNGGNNIGNEDPNLDSLSTPRGGPYNLPVNTFNIVPRNPNNGESGAAYEQTVASPAVDYLVALDAPTSAADELSRPRGLSQFGGFGTPGSKRFDLGAYEFDPHIQAETTVVAKYSGPAPTVYSDSNALNGQGLAFQATKAGQYATVVFTSPRDGCYHLWVRALTGQAAGQFQVNYSPDLSGTLTGYSPWGSKQDLYSTKSSYEIYDLGYLNYNFVIGNNYYFQFLVVGKNASSKGYALAIDTVDLVFETSSSCGM